MKVAIGIGSFLLGGVVGALIGQQLLKKRYEDIANEEIESMRQMFERMDARAAFGRGSGKSTLAGDLIVEAVENELDENLATGTPAFRHIPPVAVRSSLDDALNPYENAKTKYNIQQKIEDEPVPDALVDAVVDPLLGIDRSKPYLIKEDEYAGDMLDDHEKLTLVFYLDGVIMNEDDEMLEDISNTIGDFAYRILTREQKNIWIRNEPMLADYEIIVLHQAYGEQEPPSSESMRRRKANEEQ